MNHASRSLKHRRIANAEPVDQAVADDAPQGSQPGAAEPEQSVAPGDETQETSPSSEGPEVLRHLVIGINEVTKALESIAHTHRQRFNRTSAVDAETTQSRSPPSYAVLACRGDVDPPVLISHLPSLVATCNSFRHQLVSAKPKPTAVWLLPLPKGAETTLAEALGLRRAAVVLIKVGYSVSMRSILLTQLISKSSAPKFDLLAGLLQNVSIVAAPWLMPSEEMGALVPSHIKLLRTSAPKDMKAAKEQRLKGRVAAKERQRDMRHAIPNRVKVIAGQEAG